MREAIPKYGPEWLRLIATDAERSARVIVPLLIDLFSPESVIDVGCGTAAWLSEFRTHGVDDVVGVDGDYVQREELTIPVERFVPADLEAGVELDREFDLALCLEVAEHLSAAAAPKLIGCLARLAPNIAFSAAVPGQGGNHHVNEQWPSYWSELFAQRGYTVWDCIRPRIWTDDRVAFWYSQNTFLYCRSKPQRSDEALGWDTIRTPLEVVHPMALPNALWRVAHATPAIPSLRAWLRMLPSVARQAAHAGHTRNNRE